jgi:hypothetical protein
MHIQPYLVFHKLGRLISYVDLIIEFQSCIVFTLEKCDSHDILNPNSRIYLAPMSALKEGQLLM